MNNGEIQMYINSIVMKWNILFQENIAVNKQKQSDSHLEYINTIPSN